jgi:conjugal transfer pilus assembly protein TraW
MKALLMSLLMSACAYAHAHSFGVVGEVFPVAEQSFLSLIQERLAALDRNGTLQRFNQAWLKRAGLQADRPNPLNLMRATQKKTHYYTPELLLTQDITDIKGHILYPKGTRVNALERLPYYNPCWLFFNADDAAQRRWAKAQMQGCQNPKLILTGGAVSVAEKALQAVIYFDQAGRLSQKLHIGFVPALITRKHNRLCIEEQVIKERGDVL